MFWYANRYSNGILHLMLIRYGDRPSCYRQYIIFSATWNWVPQYSIAKNYGFTQIYVRYGCNYPVHILKAEGSARVLTLRRWINTFRDLKTWNSIVLAMKPSLLTSHELKDLSLGTIEANPLPSLGNSYVGTSTTCLWPDGKDPWV
jgi:hypothetical protein